MEITVKPLRNVLLAAGICLFTASCGNDTQQEEPLTESQAPAVLPDTLKVKRFSKTYVITGIGVRGTNSVAIINNQILSQGEEIDPGVILKNIYPTYACIVHENKEHLLRPENIQNEMGRKKK